MTLIFDEPFAVLADADAGEPGAELHVGDHVERQRRAVGRCQGEAGRRNVVLADPLASELDADVVAVAAAALHVGAVPEVVDVAVGLVGDVVAGDDQGSGVMAEVEEEAAQVGLQRAVDGELESNRPVSDFARHHDHARLPWNSELDPSHL